MKSMKNSLLIMALLLAGVSAGAQTPLEVYISDDYSENGKSYNNGYEYVDLGLKVQWATMNVNATTPEDYGGYYAWGETATNTTYTWVSYKYHLEYKIESCTVRKYCTYSDFGTVDNKTTLEAEDDAAQLYWGSTWRMPTDAEWAELSNQCTSTKVIQNDVVGFRVTSKKNGKSIFLPAAGYRDDMNANDKNPIGEGKDGYYWSSSLTKNYPLKANGVRASASGVRKDEFNRYCGLSIRPVWQDDSLVTNYTLTLYAEGCDAPNTFVYAAGQQFSVSANPMWHRHFVRWNDGNTDNPRLVTLNQDITYTAIFVPDSFNISLAASPATYGSVSGAGRYQYDDTATLTAMPDYGYEFSKWSDGNIDNPRTLPVTNNKSLQAIFTKKQFHLEVSTSDSLLGSVSGSGNYLYQDRVTIQAYNKTGATFLQWNDGNTDNPRTLSLLSDSSFTASFHQVHEGKCGDNLSWKYTDNTLTITGTGAMYNYTDSTMPWIMLRDSIRDVVIFDGVNSMGDYALYGCHGLKTITCESMTPMTLGHKTWDECEKSLLIYVHMTCREVYKQQWSAYADKIYPMLAEGKAAATDSIHAIVKSVTNAEIIAMADAVKQEINQATGGPEVEKILKQAVSDLNLSIHFLSVGEQGGEAKGYKEGKADGYEEGYAALQATLPTDPEGTAGTQVVITKDAKTLTLINPDKVKYSKVTE